MDLKAISNVSLQLNKACEKIDTLAIGIGEIKQLSPNLKTVYEELLLDEIKHSQILTLELTKLATSSEHNDDGSAFAAGELDSVIGKTEDDETD